VPQRCRLCSAHNVAHGSGELDDVHAVHLSRLERDLTLVDDLILCPLNSTFAP
jgi:hypothetical protein